VPQELHLTIAKHSGSFTLTLGGEIDLSNSEDLVSAARLALSSKPCESLTLDMADVTFIDSTGLSALVMINNECKEQSATLAMVNVPARLCNLIELAGLDGVLPVT
jgi:anti-anti-sigma factor